MTDSQAVAICAAIMEATQAIRPLSGPSRPASIEEERLAMGWVQQVMYGPAPGDNAEVGGLGWMANMQAPAGYSVAVGWIFAAGCWVRWLVPVEAP